MRWWVLEQCRKESVHEERCGWVSVKHSTGLCTWMVVHDVSASLALELD